MANEEGKVKQAQDKVRALLEEQGWRSYEYSEADFFKDRQLTDKEGLRVRLGFRDRSLVLDKEVRLTRADRIRLKTCLKVEWQEVLRKGILGVTAAALVKELTADLVEPSEENGAE